MARRKLNEEQVEALMRDYDAWEKFNPDSESAEELAARHGISKPTLYNIRERWVREHADPARASRPPGDASHDDLQAVIRYLTEQLVEARVHMAELERQVQVNHDRITELEQAHRPQAVGL